MRKENMQKRTLRNLKDGIWNGITYLASGVSVVVLISIFIFIFSKGSSSLGLDLLKGDYWAKNYLCGIQEGYQTPTLFQPPSNLHEQASFSTKWGVAFMDAQDENKENVVLLEYVDEDSPFAHLYDKSIHEQTKMLQGEVGFQIERIRYVDAKGDLHMVGNVMAQTAEELATRLDDEASHIEELYFKTPGGGIRGSIIATLYLIVTALSLALPLGIGAAIYLQEYARKGRFTNMLRSAIEMLAGVPSIIYGLMGVSVLFPITQLFGATSTNILLGGLTLAIILLPTIIRSCEEALYVVPSALRDASLSLGASQSQTIFKVVLPNALPGILTGIMLSIGRIIGESAALIYTMGTYVNDTPSLLSQGSSLAVHIYNIMSSEQPNFELACAIAIVILCFVLLLNILIKLVSYRYHKALG